MAAAESARRAAVDDAQAIAGLLHDFNTEFGEPSPGAEVLTARLRVLLAGDRTFALISGSPPIAVALVTLRPNVWYAGQVALLDELYVVPERRGQGIGSSLIGLLRSTAEAMSVDLIEINVDEGDVDAQRFYERHGYAATAPGSAERAFYYWQELTPECRQARCHSSIRVPSGSVTQPKTPTPAMSCVSSTTSAPLARR